MINKRYFCVSDIHSFASQLKDALFTAGFNMDNPSHILVVLGDVFDRGRETLETYNFLKSISEDRCILIRGNHEDLFLDLLKKDRPDSYDFSNGTVQTFCDIAKDLKLHPADFIPYYVAAFSIDFSSVQISKLVETNWKKVKNYVSKSEITKWIRSNRWKNYLEIDKYILTHSFIPDIRAWRSQATKREWSQARWGCPWQFMQYGLFDEEIKKGKKLICGHWHTSDFHKYFDENPSKEYNYEIYFGKNIIALDACTAVSDFCNVLIIDEQFNCYDQYQNKLETRGKL